MTERKSTKPRDHSGLAVARIAFTGIAFTGIAFTGITLCVLLAVGGCRRPVEEAFADMVEIEHRLDEEISRFGATIRTLRANWDVSDLEEEHEEYRERLKDAVRGAFRIRKAFEDGEADSVATRKAAAEYLRQHEVLVDEVAAARIRVERMREMTDASKLGLAEVAERHQVARRHLGAIADPDERLLFESKLLALDESAAKARDMLEKGMREVGENMAAADVVFESGRKQLMQVKVTLDAIIDDMRAELARQDVPAAGSDESAGGGTGATGGSGETGGSGATGGSGETGGSGDSAGGGPAESESGE